MSESSHAPGELASGTVFGGFEIEGVLGRGAMGIVYRAKDVRLHRQVALKVVAAHLAADESFRERFVSEARAAAMVEHVGIVAVYAAGEDGDTPFIAMKLIDGPELSDVLHRAGKLAPQEALKILTPIAAGLDAAAAAGIVHRDVKPSNILVPADNSGAVLVDFGIGRIKGSSRATQSGSWIGTADYVAPEQIQGGDIDGRADQYSLACVLYELLTGAPPYVRADTMQTLWAHVNEEPASLIGHVSGATPELDAVLQRGLAKDAADRFSTAVEMIDAAGIACGLASQGPPTAPPVRRGTGTIVKGEPPPRRAGTGTVVAGATPTKRATDKRLVIGAIATVAVAVAIIAIVMSTSGDATPTNPPNAATSDNPSETTTDLVATAQADFDALVEKAGRWRVFAKSPNGALTDQVNKCAEVGSSSEIAACMKPVSSRPIYQQIVHWFDPLPAKLSVAFNQGATDARFKSKNQACYDKANRALELGSGRATHAGELYKAYAAGDSETGGKVLALITEENTEFTGAWKIFIGTCKLPTAYG